MGEADSLPTPNPDPSAGGDPSDPAVRLSTFQALSAGLPASTVVRCTAQLNGKLYAVVEASAGNGLYVLDSGSTEWHAVDIALRTGEHFTSIVRVDFDLYATAAHATTPQGSTFKFDHTRGTWAKLAGAPDVQTWTVVKRNDEILLATLSALYVSKDSGATFARRGTQWAAPMDKPLRQLVAAKAQTRLFAVQEGTGGYGALYYSDDAGETWQTNIVPAPVRGFAADTAYAFADVKGLGAVRSDNYGSTFKPMNMGVTAQNFVTLGKKVFAATMNGLRLSEDGGGTWKDPANGLPTTEVKSIHVAGSSMLAATVQGVFVAEVR